MTLRKLFLPIIAVAVMLTGLTACNSNDDNGEMEATYANIVTLKSYTKGGDMTVDYMPGQFKEVVTLTAQALPDTAGVVTLGDRFLMAYQLPAGLEVNQSGRVNVVAYQKVFNSSVKVVNMDQYSGWSNTIAQVNDMSMSSTYLNVGILLPIILDGVQLGLLADENSLVTDTAQLYVYTYIPGSNDVSYTAVRYASFDLSSLMRNYPNVRNVMVHSPNSSMSASYKLYPSVNTGK